MSNWEFSVTRPVDLIVMIQLLFEAEVEFLGCTAENLTRPAAQRPIRTNTSIIALCEAGNSDKTKEK
jgi:hypothetical protein